jgi:hypothetical protein
MVDPLHGVVPKGPAPKWPEAKAPEPQGPETFTRTNDGIEAVMKSR